MRVADGWMALLLGVLLVGKQPTDAIYKDDAGVLDFSVATAGHGAFGWAAFSGENTVLTTDVSSSSGSGTSCYVASRSISDGSLEWRRNVCSSSDASSQSHAAVTDGQGTLFTVDSAGYARSWAIEDGGLLWDAKIGSGSITPKVFYVWSLAIASGSELVFVDGTKGSVFDSISAPEPKDGQHVEWLSVLPSKSSPTALQVVFAMVDSSTGKIPSGNDIYVGSYKFGSNKFPHNSGQLTGKDILPDSVKVSGDGDIWAIASDGKVVYVGPSGKSQGFPANSFVPSWSTAVGFELTKDPAIMQVSGKADDDYEATMGVFQYDGSSWKLLVESTSGTDNSAYAFAPKFGAVIITPSGKPVEVYDSSSGAKLEIEVDVFGGDGDSVSIVSVKDGPKTAQILIGTERGSTTLLSLTKMSGTKVGLEVLWTAEEGLANLSSAIILDASHLGSDDLVEEQNEIAYKLSVAGRLKAQMQEIGAVLSTANGLIGSGSIFDRDHMFGFLKVSALLSSKSHKMWGMSTAGADRGSIRWSLDLPKKALWHSMVHGTTNAATVAHGIHGDTHSREILVLSALEDKVEWMCIDGTSGAINAQDSISIKSPIVQVLPVYGTSTGGCRQASLLLGADSSLTVVPEDAPTKALIENQLQKTPNGLYTHSIDRDTNVVESYRVSSEQDGFVARPVGLTAFEGEEIVEVAYPLRHEDMQSMSTILGDNSLLLKYINPHMAVVVTMLSNKEDQSATEVATALEKETEEKTPRKPKGASAPGSSTAPQEEASTSQLPNMFVNLVDTVSGRVLYRHSHSSVDPSKTVSVVISENWVVYSYTNAKTRRTELGVLTLHEGMIEPKGLTYFARPEQSTSFSSFDARESKPVVLSKVYAFPKAVTALGVTSTRQGIGRQNILLAGADGSLTTLNKMILETRRPVGDVKPDEKKEGLMAYNELIPDSPLLTLNYNQTEEPFSSIVSTTTALESQSLVFGFGGPDLFFTRTSPTKGFDLLPETFNKMLVGLTTVGIVLALLTVQKMGTKKALKHGWS